MPVGDSKSGCTLKRFSMATAEGGTIPNLEVLVTGYLGHLVLSVKT